MDEHMSAMLENFVDGRGPVEDSGDDEFDLTVFLQDLGLAGGDDARSPSHSMSSAAQSPAAPTHSPSGDVGGGATSPPTSSSSLASVMSPGDNDQDMGCILGPLHGSELSEHHWSASAHQHGDHFRMAQEMPAIPTTLVAAMTSTGNSAPPSQDALADGMAQLEHGRAGSAAGTSTATGTTSTATGLSFSSSAATGLFAAVAAESAHVTRQCIMMHRFLQTVQGNSPTGQHGLYAHAPTVSAAPAVHDLGGSGAAVVPMHQRSWSPPLAPPNHTAASRAPLLRPTSATWPAVVRGPESMLTMGQLPSLAEWAPHGPQQHAPTSSAASAVHPGAEHARVQTSSQPSPSPHGATTASASLPMGARKRNTRIAPRPVAKAKDSSIEQSRIMRMAMQVLTEQRSGALAAAAPKPKPKTAAASQSTGSARPLSARLLACGPERTGPNRPRPRLSIKGGKGAQAARIDSGQRSPGHSPADLMARLGAAAAPTGTASIGTAAVHHGVQPMSMHDAAHHHRRNPTQQGAVGDSIAHQRLSALHDAVAIPISGSPDTPDASPAAPALLQLALMSTDLHSTQHLETTTMPQTHSATSPFDSWDWTAGAGIRGMAPSLGREDPFLTRIYQPPSAEGMAMSSTANTDPASLGTGLAAGLIIGGGGVGAAFAADTGNNTTAYDLVSGRSVAASVALPAGEPRVAFSSAPQRARDPRDPHELDNFLGIAGSALDVMPMSPGADVANSYHYVSAASRASPSAVGEFGGAGSDIAHLIGSHLAGPSSAAGNELPSSLADTALFGSVDAASAYSVLDHLQPGEGTVMGRGSGLGAEGQARSLSFRTGGRSEHEHMTSDSTQQPVVGTGAPTLDSAVVSAMAIDGTQHGQRLPDPAHNDFPGLGLQARPELAMASQSPRTISRESLLSTLVSTPQAAPSPSRSPPAASSDGESGHMSDNDPSPAVGCSE